MHAGRQASEQQLEMYILSASCRQSGRRVERDRLTDCVTETGLCLAWAVAASKPTPNDTTSDVTTPPNPS